MAYANGYTYKRVISIDNTKVPANMTDYPMLVNSTNNDFRSVANGGHVENGANLDIRFEVSGVKLAHEIERYVDTTGEVIAWVKVPAVSSSTATDIDMFYGKSGVSDEQDLTTLWSDYMWVWHGTSNVESKGNTLTDTSSSDTAGAIGRGRYFNGSARLNTTISGNTNTQTFTWESVTNPDSSTGTQIYASLSAQMYLRTISGTYNISLRIAGAQVAGLAGQTITAGVNNFLVVTYDGANRRLFKNASAGSVIATTGDLQIVNGSQRTIGGYNNGNASPFAGMFDEYRISTTVVRDGDWITAQYNNMSAPGTFYSLGNEETSGVPAAATNFFNMF